jgi:hypothetical protein
VWDVFISHASEDKDIVARPLADALQRAGARVWFDKHELKLGDSLSRKIDQGLASSRFGVVILSPNFFAKHWPMAELAGLRALDEDGQKRILPVWHNVDRKTVASYSPIIADLLAVPTSLGPEKLSQAILDVIFSPSAGASSNDEKTVSRRLIELIERYPAKDELISFLQSHWPIIAQSMHSNVPPLWNICVGGVMFDAVAVGNLVISGGPSLECVLFLPVWESPFESLSANELVPSGSPVPLLSEALASVDKVHKISLAGEEEDAFSDIVRRLLWREPSRRYIGMEAETFESSNDLWNDVLAPIVTTTIFCGRRKIVDRTKAAALAWRDIRINNPSCRLHTYDRLIEEFQNIGVNRWIARE